MTLLDMKSLYLGMNVDQQSQVLSRLILNLSVAARVGLLHDLPDDKVRTKMAGINELIHRIAGQLIHILSSDDRYPDDVFIDIVTEEAELRNCSHDLLQAWQWSLPTELLTTH